MHRRMLLVFGLTLAACSHDGRSLRPPRPSQTLSVITTTVPPSTSAAPQTTSQALSLVLPFPDGGPIDARFTCKAANGHGVSPGVSWAGIPPDTKELALVVTDPDAGGFVHWVLTGIDPNATNSVAEGAVPAGLHQGSNGFATTGWGGPCPPSGTHHYRFTLYALSQASGVTDGMGPAAAIALIEDRSVATATVTATFGV